MVNATAEARGRASIRPWRVGLLVDTTSGDRVREAISDLSSVWGGRFMPILDINANPRDLERLAAMYDVDSLYADTTEGPLGDLLRKPGWSWNARGPWGPFGEEHGFRKGLLPVRAFLNPDTDLVQPLWDVEEEADLGLAAIWGLPDRLGVDLSNAADANGPRLLTVAQAIAEADKSGRLTGALEATAMHVRPLERRYLDDYCGLVVLRNGNPTDVVDFWNMRTYGSSVGAVPARCSPELVRWAVNSTLLRSVLAGSDGETAGHETLVVWGLDEATSEVAKELHAVAGHLGLQVESRERLEWPLFVFPGVETPFARAFRTDFHPAARRVDVPLPSLPIREEVHSYSRGVVAADLRMLEVSGQDPRLTATIPPYRRHSQLLRPAYAGDGVDHARVAAESQVLGIDAQRDHAPFTLVYNLDVFQLMFGDESGAVAQSDIGKFQSRAAEKFSGAFSGTFNQPGIRSAVLLAARDREGVAMQHLRQIVERDRGEWPGPFSSAKPSEYAEQALNYLLHAGLFVPALRVHCSHCRVERWASAEELAPTMTCEFCGEPFNLALSHSLALPKWRYRLAAHLRPDQVQALLPALAVCSVVGQFRHFEEPPLPHVLGLEAKVNGRKVELDVAIYLPGNDWLAVIGEVKSANRIDENDVRNVWEVQRRFREEGVRSLSLFATLKDQFNDDEVAVLRQRVERSPLVTTTHGQVLPSMPLVLTGPDVSHHPDSREHPWRWNTGYYSGLLGAAITSCERNLGLSKFEMRQGSVVCEWADGLTSKSAE